MAPAAITTPTAHPGAGGRLVLVESAMGSAAPRLMVAPRGARLPPGVHEVAPLLFVAAGPRRRLPQGARGVVAAAAGDPGRSAALGLGCFSSASAPAAAAFAGGFLADTSAAGALCAGGGTRVTGLALVGTGASRARPGAAGLGGAGSTAVAAAGLCFGGAAFTGDRSSRRTVPRALDLGDEGGGEEDPSDELRYQQAHRQMQAAVYMVCLRRRVEVASDFGLLPSGRERRLILEEIIGDIDAAAPMYHWLISRCHDRLRSLLDADLYKDIITATPKDEEKWKWVVQTDSAIIVKITTLMADIQYSIMHDETWRVVVRDHPLYDVCPLFLNKLAESAAEFTNIALACFKR